MRATRKFQKSMAKIARSAYGHQGVGSTKISVQVYYIQNPSIYLRSYEGGWLYALFMPCNKQVEGSK